MAMKFGDQAKRLTEYISTIDSAEARRRINLSYRRNSEAHGWQHLLARFTLQTEASYSTGTVAASGTTVTGTDTVWVTSWTTAPSSRRIAIQGRSEPYSLGTVSSATSATIGDTWLGSSDSGLTYRMFRDIYPLPGDCGMAKLMVIYDPELRQRLSFLHQPRFLGVRANDAALTGIPECFTVINMTTETPPRPQIQVYPAPSTVRAYHGWYFKRVSFLSSDDSYLEWPEEFDDMIWVLAAIEHYETPRFFSRKMLNELRPKYANLFDRMKSMMDGQTAIDFQIGEAQTTGVWNPNPLSLSGSATMDWN